MKRHTKHKAKAKPEPALALPPPSPSSVDAMLSDAEDDSQLLVLHVIRILALYLYVLLSHHQLDASSLPELFSTDSMERFVETATSSLERQLHDALLACVHGEIESNQFDGLIQEKTVLTALKRIFRQQKVKARVQCQLLARLLHRYLAQLRQAPIVCCKPMGTLVSTLDYLARNALSDKLSADPRSPSRDLSMSLLYPLVNAIDSLSIEQRECLDALTTLWKWLAACDSSGVVLDHIVRLHHAVIFCIEPSSSASPSSIDLGSCFVQTLVLHADHIFRHDLDFSEPLDVLGSDSETDEDQDDQSPSSSPQPVPETSEATALSPRKPRKPSKKSSQKSVARKEVPVPQENDEDDPATPVIDAHEPMPASMMRVGIAAAAGTLAAALCVIFT